MTYLVIGAGGFLGAIARYIVSVWIGQRWGRGFPLGTFLINVSGSFFRGVSFYLPIYGIRYNHVAKSVDLC